MRFVGCAGLGFVLALAAGAVPAEEATKPDAFDRGPFSGEPPQGGAAPVPPLQGSPPPTATYTVPSDYQVCVDPQYYDRILEAQTNNWRFQIRRRDFALMSQMAGTWERQEPNGVGGVSVVRSELHPEGSFTFEKRTCVSMPGLGTSCPSSIGHGYWAAHWEGDGTIFFATLLSFSGYTGERISGICGGGFVRVLDPYTTQETATGIVARRNR